MSHPGGPWQPGQSGNPAGKPKGARNKRTEELFERLEARGDKDPAELLSSIATNDKERKELRIQAATALLPYKYARPATTPIPRYIEKPIDELPHGGVLCPAGGGSLDP
jgi:hypothetical protein